MGVCTNVKLSTLAAVPVGDDMRCKFRAGLRGDDDDGDSIGSDDEDDKAVEEEDITGEAVFRAWHRASESSLRGRPPQTPCSNPSDPPSAMEAWLSCAPKTSSAPLSCTSRPPSSPSFNRSALISWLEPAEGWYYYDESDDVADDLRRRNEKLTLAVMYRRIVKGMP